VADVRQGRRLTLFGVHEVDFDPDEDVTLHRRRSLPYHPNGMIFTAYDGSGVILRQSTYYSVGGGFVVDELAAGADRIKPDPTVVPHPFSSPTSWPGGRRPRSARGCCTSGGSCRSVSNRGAPGTAYCRAV
jgi:hypothetical protein